MSTRPRLLGISFALFALLCGGLACYHLAASDPVDRLDWIKQRVRSEFPDLERVTTAELHERLERGTQPVLLDARRVDEYAVSHLAGALRVVALGCQPMIESLTWNAIDWIDRAWSCCLDDAVRILQAQRGTDETEREGTELLPGAHTFGHCYNAVENLLSRFKIVFAAKSSPSC